MLIRHRNIPAPLLFLFVACFVVPCVAQKRPASVTAKASTSSSDTHTWHLKREERSAPLTDWQTHQSRDFKMMSMLLPVGWQLEVRPGPNFATIDCADTSGRIMISATSPDKGTGIFVIPASATMSSNSQAFLQQKADIVRNFKGAFNCTTTQQPETLAASLQQGASIIAPDAQVVGSVVPVPGLSEEIPQIVAGANQRGNSHISAEAGRLRLAGSFQGKQVEMWLVGLATHRTESVPGGTVTYTDLPLCALVYAPPGQLDQNDKLLTTVLSSVEMDADWTRNAQYFVAGLYEKINGAYAQVNRIHQQMTQDNANAASQQAAIRSDTANYRSKVMSSVAANRSAALDHSSQQFALYMGDQAIYKDPSTGQRVQMSSGYDHVWASTTGNSSDFIMTDSASYDPNGHVGSAGWTQMQMDH